MAAESNVREGLTGRISYLQQARLPRATCALQQHRMCEGLELAQQLCEQGKVLNSLVVDMASWANVCCVCDLAESRTFLVPPVLHSVVPAG
jgi:hypothetical protein